MPSGTCSECGQEEVMGPVPYDGQPFVCCDCEQELATYNAKERTETEKASAMRLRSVQTERGGRRCSLLDRARFQLTAGTFDPQLAENSAITVLTDPLQDIFAGIGAAEVSPSANALASYVATTLPVVELGPDEQPSIEPLQVLELGAGSGAVGIWLWKTRHPQLNVCCTDVPRLLPLIRLNCEGNLALEGMSTRPLRWGVATDSKELAEDGVVWDFVIGSDVCYNEEKSFPLMQTLTELNPKHCAIISQSLHPTYGGQEAVNMLRERAIEAGWDFEQLRDMTTGVIVQGKDWGSAVMRLTPPKAGPGRRSRRSRYDQDFLLEG